jgi:hypothetical protein
VLRENGGKKKFQMLISVEMWKVVELLENIGAHVDCLEGACFPSSTTCFNFLSRHTHQFFYSIQYVPFGDIIEMMLSMRVDVDCLAI